MDSSQTEIIVCMLPSLARPESQQGGAYKISTLSTTSERGGNGGWESEACPSGLLSILTGTRGHQRRGGGARSWSIVTTKNGSKK